MMRNQRNRKENVEVNAAAGMSDRQRKELEAFARYCATRLERELGVIEGWSVRIERYGRRANALVCARDGEICIEARGSSADNALAIWEAMCQLEQPLRELRMSSSRAA